jgi:hypothetical protein
MSVQQQKQEPIQNHVIGHEGLLKYPAYNQLFHFFTPRTSKITVWSFGFNYGGIEADIVEGTGANIHVFDARQDAKERYDTVMRVLKTHKLEAGDPEWVAALKDKWVLTKRFTYDTVLPWSFDGSLNVSGVDTQLKAFSLDTTPRIDVCKIDYPSLTYDIVYMLLKKGYRPGIMYIRWDEHPDQSTPAMLCAGHLQNTGYELLKEIDGFFLYRFNDTCLYEFCSWARSDCPNPLLAELFSSINTVEKPETELAEASAEVEKESN